MNLPPSRKAGSREKSKQETLTSHNFDREGVLVLKERQDGFFRRSEGSAIRWFRLRGNLLFYLKGPEPWYEPIGVIVLGLHQLQILPQDENEYWPFQIVWDNGASYRLATFNESERTLWLKAIELASYDQVRVQVARMRELLAKIRPTVDISTYRLQKNITVEISEVPLCELALSCDNLLCDPYGKPPSPMAEIFVKNPQGPYIRYGATEIVESSSNPCFCRTIVFRGCDGLSGATAIRVLISDVRERVSGAAAPLGSADLTLATIQEAQRLRVALRACGRSPAGFLTLSGWSLEPAAPPGVEPAGRSLGHRRSQSLPPRLGLRLKCPSLGAVFRQNFVNGRHATYRFHSGLGGDIMVHEIMAEVKFCFSLPSQLLSVYMEREREMVAELVWAGAACGRWRAKRRGLLAAHRALLAHYAHGRDALRAQAHAAFKPSIMKEEPRLEWSPVNLHVQRLWAHDGAPGEPACLDLLTSGAFAAHTHLARAGLFTLVQQVQEADRVVRAEWERAAAARRLQVQADAELDAVELLLSRPDAAALLPAKVQAVIKTVSSIMNLWDPLLVEESLSLIGWKRACCNEDADEQRVTAAAHCAAQPDPAGVADADAAPGPELHPLAFDEDYFEAEPTVEREQCSGAHADAGRRAHLQRVRTELQASLGALLQLAKDPPGGAECKRAGRVAGEARARVALAVRWMRVAHAALRLRCESPAWLRDHAALQTRRDACFSQALTTLAAGLVCWLCSVPSDIVFKVLSSDLGPLCCFEGFLSLHGAEKAMWGDMVVAIEDLQTVAFTLFKFGNSKQEEPRVTGSRGALLVHLPAPESLCAMFTADEPVRFSVTTVFFNIGINDKASSGDTVTQRRSNCDSWDRLSTYSRRYCRRFAPPAPAAARASRSKPLEEVMENLKIAVQKTIPKNVEVLHLASLATRIMHGVSFISCKSGKDRTGMAVTLRQRDLLAAECRLADRQLDRALHAMRSEGCRRENALKNIGVNKFAFNKKQVLSLPAEYRPPPGTYAPAAT